jgi:putative transposase
VIDACFAELRPLVGTAGACRGSGKARATHYRRCQPPILGPSRPRSTPTNALTEEETAELLKVLRSPRFVDLAPAQVWAVALDEGRYLASISTMYRVLRGRATRCASAEPRPSTRPGPGPS